MTGRGERARSHDANWDAADELIAPNYKNTLMPGLDLAGFRAAAMGMSSVIRESHADDLTLIAEGDEVVARFNYRLTLTNGKQLSARNLSYFRLDNGKIVANEPRRARMYLRRSPL